MTRIAVFSDTHGDIGALEAALRQLGSVDAVLHLGDYASDARRISVKTKTPFAAVSGNCDFNSDFPREQVVTYEKAALYLTHGDRFTDLYRLAYHAEELHCRAALCGHTHTPLLQSVGSLLIINPGSLSRPRYGSQPSCCLLLIENGEIQVRMITL